MTRAKDLSRHIYKTIKEAYGSTSHKGLAISNPGLEPAALIILSRDIRELAGLVGGGEKCLVRSYWVGDDEVPVLIWETSDDEDTRATIHAQRMTACCEMLSDTLKSFAARSIGSVSLISPGLEPAQSKRASDLLGVLLDKGFAGDRDNIPTVTIKISEAHPNPDLDDFQPIPATRELLTEYTIDDGFIERVNADLDSDKRFSKSST